MSSTARVPVCVTLPPALIERADRIAEAAERSRSYVVAQALRAFCDAIETPQPGGASVTPPQTAAAPGAPSRGACGTGDASRSAFRGGSDVASPTSYPASLHLAATRRQADAKRAQAEALAEARDRAMQDTTENLKGIEI